MPELPEVETVRRGLAAIIVGQQVNHVEVLHPRSVRQHVGGDQDFCSRLIGQEFCMPARRGKYLWFPLTNGDAMVAHLGMSGQFRIDDQHIPLHRNTRVVFDLSSSHKLRFVDQRMFGGVYISNGGATLPDQVAHIALDPFDSNFDPQDAARRMRLRRSAVKRVMLDQTWVSGIGNIYADEALWLSQLHWSQPAALLTHQQALQLVDNICTVLAAAVAQGGTSFDALYVNVNGESGYFDRRLRAYGQEGRPCERCGTPIRREHFMNRSSFFCPRCQPHPLG